jgi:colanic acid biosynthesis protein WcaH
MIFPPDLEGYTPGSLPNDRKPDELLGDVDFRQVIWNAPLVSLDFFVRSKDGKILVGQRTNEPAKDWLFCPGGRIVKNERVEQAFQRLTKKELGTAIKISEARPLGVFQHFYPKNTFEDPNFGTHYVVLAFEITLDPETLRGDEQHSRFEWLTGEEMRSHERVHVNTKAYLEVGGGMSS